VGASRSGLLKMGVGFPQTTKRKKRKKRERGILEQLGGKLLAKEEKITRRKSAGKGGVGNVNEDPGRGYFGGVPQVIPWRSAGYGLGR